MFVLVFELESLHIWVDCEKGPMRKKLKRQDRKNDWWRQIFTLLRLETRRDLNHIGTFVRTGVGGVSQVGGGKREGCDLEHCTYLMSVLSVQLKVSLMSGMKVKEFLGSLMKGVNG